MRRPHTTLRALLFLLALTGCLTAMAFPSDMRPTRSAANHFPLKFKRHDFAAFCYNTIGCEVIYANNNFTRPYSSGKVASPPPSSDYREHWGFAGWGPIFNFPPPAQVRWRSMDGVSHEATVDIGAIFKDELVLYRVPNEEIREGAFPGVGPADDPSVFLEVNDHTINVFMKAFIPTRTEQIPGNRLSEARADLVLAWTKTY